MWRSSIRVRVLRAESHEVEAEIEQLEAQPTATPRAVSVAQVPKYLDKLKSRDITDEHFGVSGIHLRERTAKVDERFKIGSQRSVSIYEFIPQGMAVDEHFERLSP